MIVLDTHAWVRWLDPTANPLPPKLIDRIEAAETLAISAITCWEVAWLHRRERIPSNSLCQTGSIRDSAVPKSFACRLNARLPLAQRCCLSTIETRLTA